MNKQLLAFIISLFFSLNVFARLNINTASAREIEELEGMGPVSSQSIIDYRAKHGPFKTIDEVDNVPGIGPERFEMIKGHISVSDELFYKVLRGDTLSKIAKEQLGRSNQYPAIFRVNQSKLRHPDKIYPGQLLLMPTQ